MHPITLNKTTMKITTASAFILLASTEAFTTAPRVPTRTGVVANAHAAAPFFVDLVEQEEPKPVAKKQPAKKSAPKKGGAHKEGIFSPAVNAAKVVLGEEKLNSVRGKAINLHSTAIKNFVATAESAFGENVLRSLFNVADKNHNGMIEEDELREALQKLGFSWLKDKQVHGIFTRAGGDEKGYLTLEDWLKEAPKTLSTNLVKLAKTNGGELGFLV